MPKIMFQALTEKSKSIQGVRSGPYKAVANAFEIIPRTLIQNCGGSTIRQLTALRAKHAQDPAKNWTWGINGNTGELADMEELGIWDPMAVRLQAIKTAIETVKFYKIFLKIKLVRNVATH